ncbi:MAG: hypothetical protein IPM63_12040 [Acidobacteriota bacterium]|nr:MAG: hypothetical protein IPM63_12040 [Acidobacteriota bacterium]
MKSIPKLAIGAPAALLFAILLAHSADGRAPERVNVTIVTDEAEAVLKALDSARPGRPVPEELAAAVFRTEGYKRLKEREHSLGRKFDDDDFASFLTSPELIKRRAAFRKTLHEWLRADVNAIAAGVLEYLPAKASIRAKIYPVIKPATNSFVFDLSGDPAIFLYLDPDLTRAKFENTLAHELHHIGFGTACPPSEAADETKLHTAGQQKVLRWAGAFGEGFAMLAAAGGPDVHPHSASPKEERERWDADVATFASDKLKVEKFFLDLLDGKLDESKEIETARSFYGIQGPWYTVGWKMAVVIEEELGRGKLIECFCDGRRLFSTFNEAALKREKRDLERLPLWDQRLLFGNDGD